MKNHLVAALAYEGLCTFEFGCVTEVFALHRPELQTDWYQFAVCSMTPGNMRAAGGLQIQCEHDLRLLEKADTILIPGWQGVHVPVPAELVAALQAAAARGARIASICSGVFVLAAAGLLDGKTATTHWRYTGILQQRFPEIRVNENVLYVDEGQIISSAGSAAGIDMLLHLIRKDHGDRIANLVARRMVVSGHRDGGQAQYLPRPVLPDGAGALQTLMRTIRAAPGKPYTLSSMADLAAVSVRTLQRQFTDSTGMSPMVWLTRERIASACELLEETSLPLTRIAEHCGFGSEESMRHHFRQWVHCSPSRYRQQFGLASNENAGQQIV
ncbi:transcriptional regulator FtrA [Undibacterium luofuense]|uniref:Transcriptional regulator FtrA n=1 Tax=Undibacterium luofuense TaxID=2828733 RepID=A0A941I8D9_9BURK|nr:transcriptional regulator FtrA [Undibacterium luofuense]MBR7783774.1 transcriptional regulator FtrA [Undibacterium luofuense]